MHGPGWLTLALSGAPGSGKSTLATALANEFGAQIGSFGRFVAHLAGGSAGDRRALQDIGETEVRADPAGFVERFVAWSDAAVAEAFIADGLRHVVIDRELRRWSDSEDRTYVHIHLAADRSLRAQRRTGGDEIALDDVDSHPVERGAATDLPRNADVLVQPSWILADVVEQVVTAARRSVV